MHNNNNSNNNKQQCFITMLTNATTDNSNKLPQPINVCILSTMLSARPAVTFPATDDHHPFTDTKLYHFVTEAHVCEHWTTCRESLHASRMAGSRCHKSNHYSTNPHVTPYIYLQVKGVSHFCTPCVCHSLSSDIAGSLSGTCTETSSQRRNCVVISKCAVS